MERWQELIHSVFRIEGSLKEWMEHYEICPYCNSAPLVGGTTADTYMPLATWMDSQAVMAYLNISRRTFFRFKNKEILKSRRVGKRDYFFALDLEKALAQSISKGKK